MKVPPTPLHCFCTNKYLVFFIIHNYHDTQAVTPKCPSSRPLPLALPTFRSQPTWQRQVQEVERQGQHGEQEEGGGVAEVLQVHLTAAGQRAVMDEEVLLQLYIASS